MATNTWEIIRAEIAKQAETSPANIAEFKIDYIKETAEISFVSPIDEEDENGRVTVGLTYFRWTKRKEVK